MAKDNMKDNINFNSDKFKADDLILSDFQYEIIHKTTDAFTIGEKVFLKSNPEVPMIVDSIDHQKVICKHQDMLISFRPEIILQYKHSVFLIVKRKFKICLN